MLRSPFPKWNEKKLKSLYNFIPQNDTYVKEAKAIVRFRKRKSFAPLFTVRILWYNRRMNETAFYRETNARTLRGPYLLLGSEELTKQEALDRVLALLDPGFADMNLHRLKEPEAKELLGAADQLPFFDAFHIVVVSDWSDADLFEGITAEEKKRKGTIDRFFSLPDAIVLFVRRGDAKETNFTRMFSGRDRVVRFDALTPDRAAKFCLREAAQKGAVIDDRTARALIDMVGTDAYRLRNELSKAAGFVGSGKAITQAVLGSVVTPSAEYNAFKMLDALLAGNKKAAARMLEPVLSVGKESPMGIAGFLEGRLRLMLIAREMLDRKRPRAEIVSRIGGSLYAADAAIKSAQKQSSDTLKNAVASFAEINALVKEGACDERNALFTAIYKNF